MKEEVIKIILNENIIATAQYDRKEWCGECDYRRKDCKYEIKSECLTAMHKYLLEEAFKDAEMELK